jgi:hypothetical protein
MRRYEPYYNKKYSQQHFINITAAEEERIQKATHDSHPSSNIRCFVICYKYVLFLNPPINVQGATTAIKSGEL